MAKNHTRLELGKHLLTPRIKSDILNTFEISDIILPMFVIENKKLN